MEDTASNLNISKQNSRNAWLHCNANNIIQYPSAPILPV